MYNNTWEIMYLIDKFNKRYKECSDSDQAKIIQEKYARALQIVCKDDVGKIMTIEDFQDDVREGVLSDKDGVAIFLDWEGNRRDLAYCDIHWLEKNKKDYPFVRWFNR